MHTKLLPSSFSNPASTQIILRVLAEFGQLANLVGFASTDCPVESLRQYMYASMDMGAHAGDAHDDPVPDSHGRLFQRIIPIMGVFHECKMYLQVVMQILFSLVGGKAGGVPHLCISSGAEFHAGCRRHPQGERLPAKRC